MLKGLLAARKVWICWIGISFYWQETFFDCLDIWKKIAWPALNEKASFSIGTACDIT